MSEYCITNYVEIWVPKTYGWPGKKFKKSRVPKFHELDQDYRFIILNILTIIHKELFSLKNSPCFSVVWAISVYHHLISSELRRNHHLWLYLIGEGEVTEKFCFAQYDLNRTDVMVNMSIIIRSYIDTVRKKSPQWIRICHFLAALITVLRFRLA